MALIKKISLSVGLIGVLILLSWNMQVWHQTFLGWSLLGIYLFVLAFCWQQVLLVKFSFPAALMVSWFLGVLIPILINSFFMAVAITWSAVPPSVSWFSLVLTAIISIICYYRVSKVKRQEVLIFTESEPGLDFSWWRLAFLIGYGIIWLLGWFCLLSSHGSTALLSPWQVIPPIYVLLFFCSIALVAILLFARIKISWLLLLVIAQSLLTHGYLAYSHQLPYGGDVWRHIGIEQQLVNGQVVPPVLVGEGSQVVEIAGFSMPAVLVQPYKYTYAQYWGFQVMITQITQTSLLEVHRFGIPLLWSLEIPLLLFLVGFYIFKNIKSALFLGLAPSLFFPLQSLGALSLPVSWGLIIFLFGLWLAFMAFEQNNETKKHWVVYWGIAMAFSYPLYFIAYWLFVLWLWFWNWQVGRTMKTRILVGGLVGLVSLIILPIIELLSGYSHWLFNASFWDSVKKIGSGLLAWRFVSLAPGDTLTFNWIVNQVPQEAFVNNIFTVWRGWLPLLLIGIWFLVIWGILLCFRRNSLSLRAIGSLMLVFLGNYFIGWFLLTGERIFTRRLDLLIAVFIGIMIILVIQELYEQGVVFFAREWLVYPLVCLMALIGVTAYTSGPDLRVVSLNEYHLAQAVWQRSNHQANKHCVLADDWVLLALEGVSGGKIVGGGFPLHLQYQQPERKEIMVKMDSGTNARLLAINQAKILTGASQCFVVKQGIINTY